MIQMPWTNSTAPNVMIEIADACNLACRVCYKRLSTHLKSLDKVRQDLKQAMELRPLHTVTISGGEPTLHPDLCTVVEMIKEEGLHVFLLTNGILIDREFLERLKNAGLDSILFHVDLGQKRADLPDHPAFSDIKKRLDELVALADSFDIDASISFTLYEEGDEAEIGPYFLQSPKPSFMFLSSAQDLRNFYASIDSDAIKNSASRPRATSRIRRYFQDRHGIEPFAYIPTQDGKDTVWISYFIPVVYARDGIHFYRYRSTWMDIFLMRTVKFFTGRYIHKTIHNAFLTSLRVFLNGITSRRFVSSIKFLILSWHPGSDLRHKMIVYDDGPFITDAHTVERCEYCPTAIVRNGELLPCCAADYGPKE